MAEKKKDEKKIIVDEDWKQQAQKEKAVSAAMEEAEKKKASNKEQIPKVFPPGDFAALVSTLVTQSLFALGLLEIEGEGKKKTNLELAKYNIDMLETLEEKTKNNLTENEKRVLQNTLDQVRMAYVKIAG